MPTRRICGWSSMTHRRCRPARRAVELLHLPLRPFCNELVEPSRLFDGFDLARFDLDQ